MIKELNSTKQTHPYLSDTCFTSFFDKVYLLSIVFFLLSGTKNALSNVFDLLFISS